MNEYPKWRIHRETGAETIVYDAAAESALGEGWGGQQERLNFLAQEELPDKGVIVNSELELRRPRGRPRKAVADGDSA